MRGLPLQAIGGGAFRLLGAAALALAMFGGTGASAASGSASGDLDQAQANCRAFAKANARYISAAPKAFCGCLVTGVRDSQPGADGAALVGLMAETAPTGKGGWAWWQSESLKGALGDDASRDTRALSQSIRMGMSRCSAGEDYAALSRSAQILEDGAVAQPLVERARAHCVSAMKGFGDRVPHPDAMCGCMLDQTRARFAPEDAAVVIAAMADEPPMAGHWEAWTQAASLRVSGGISSARAGRLSKAVREKLGGKTQRQCAAAKPGDQSAMAAPQAAPKVADAAEQCGDKPCFADHFSQCRPAAYTDAVKGLGTLKLEVVGAGSSDGDCRVRLWFTDNPNPGWVNKPLLMTLDTAKPFAAQYGDGLKACLGADAPGAFACAGPLRGIAAQ